MRLSRLEKELEIPSLPEMLFGDTFLQILHEDGGGVAFNAIDALRLVDNKNDLIKVACAEEWRKQRYVSCLTQGMYHVYHVQNFS